MKDQRVFLSAEWKNLLMLNFAVDPSLLERFVPSGTELDTFDGVTYLSLVGFEFNRTRMFGIAVPFHQSFEEVNLRFYVRRHSRRGVVFVREFVPKRAVALIARFAFNENYSRMAMSHRIESYEPDGRVRAEYAWGSGVDRFVMRIETEGPSFLPADDSVSQFVSEHYWGYAAQPDGGSLEYEVQHPRWKVRCARSARFSGNAGALYGEKIAEYLNRIPDSAFLADGSTVTVFKGKRID
jgi:uncharacterized protein